MKNISPIFKVLRQIALLILATVSVSCSQKDLCFPGEEICIVDVEFLWKNMENVSVEGMSTYFFPLYQGGKMWNFEIAGKNGGLVSLPCGQYTLIAVNNDLPGVDISYGETNSSIIVSARYYDDATLRPSGMIYGAVIDKLFVHSNSLFSDKTPSLQYDRDSRHTIKIFPDSISTVYNINVTDISESDRIVDLYARLSGVAVSLSLDGSSGEKSASLNIPLEKSNEGMRGYSTGLGAPAGTPHFTLTLYAELLDSRKSAKSISFDVTEQILQAHDPHNIFILLSGISFSDGTPDSPDDSSDVGMDVDVDEWNTINVDLITGV